MVRQFASAVLLTTLLAVPNALAASECVDLAASIGMEASQYNDQEQVKALNLSNFCSENYKASSGSRRASIEASYNLFSGSASGSESEIEKEQQRRCGGVFGSQYYDRVTSQDLKVVSQAGARVIEGCLNSKNFRLINVRAQGAGVVADFRYGGDSPTTINGPVIRPQEIADCEVYMGGKKYAFSDIVGKQLVQGQSMSLQCTRKFEKKDGRNVFEAGVIGISTTADSVYWPLVGYSDPLVPEKVAEGLQRQVDELRARVDTLTKWNEERVAEVASIRRETERLQADKVSGVSFGSGAEQVGGIFSCPENQVISSITLDRPAVVGRIPTVEPGHVKCSTIQVTK